MMPSSPMLIAILIKNDVQPPHFAPSRLLKNTNQSRGFRGSTRLEHSNHNGHSPWRIKKYKHSCISRMREEPASHLRRNQMLFNHAHDPWWKVGWGWGQSKSCFPSPHKDTRHKKDFWDAERDRMQKRMEQIKREIDADPYVALFGKRTGPFDFPKSYEKDLFSFCRSVFGLDKADESGTINTTPSPKTAKDAPLKSQRNNGSPSSSSSKEWMMDNTQGASQNAGREDLTFDPISGRMIPRKPRASSINDKHIRADNEGSSSIPAKKNGRSEKNVGYLSTVDRSGEKSEPLAGPYAGAGYDLPESFTLPLGKNSMHEHLTNDTDAGVKPREARYDSQKPSAQDISVDVGVHGSCGKGHQPSSAGREAAIDQTKPGHKQPPVDTQNDQSSKGLPSVNSVRQDHLAIRDERSEDLDILSASDIRSRYNTSILKRNPKERHELRKEMEDQFSSSVDSVSDIDAQTIRETFLHRAASEPGATKTASPSLGNLDQLEKSPDVAESPKNTIAQESIQPSGQAVYERQLNPSNPGSVDTYRILAYDPSTLEISQAETTSPLHKSHEVLHPTEILPQLNNPAKFLPYFEKMKADGFAIVSGGGDILVFKKTHGSERLATDHSITGSNRDLSAFVRPEPLFNEITDQTEPAQKIPEESEATHVDPKQNQNSDDPPLKSESRVGNIFRRMFIGGIATAATCYALGVVSEYFRTGGQDGRGIDGFTEFESERRHRDRN
ncbi:hypothetical protein BDV25DRAFT_86281 [Aspergillus avenaceus]|uniref:Serine-threonine rich protein n=1 Tax=Aspergillus avenaceus TaxID=36643 RepID=A0A5N6TEG9_ASPAV|nr:hypothetical protein BDV25DRAFT_86281 [Aspergillus avenaceus]